MSSLIRLIYRQGHYFQNITKPVKWSGNSCFSMRIVCYNANCRRFLIKPLLEYNKFRILPNSARHLTAINNENPTPDPKPQKPSLIQRFKQMSKDYWYVVLPVHLTTSAIWFGSFYYCVQSGVDVIYLLESLGINENLLKPIKESSAGYFALAFALYKLATPLRYAVTVGGTTFAIKKLTVIGWIKPMPSPERLKEMIQEKKELFQEKKDNIQDKFTTSKQHYQTQLKEKKTQVLEEMRRYKQEIKNTKNNAKKT